MLTKEERLQKKWRKRLIELSGPMLLRACKNALEESHNPTVKRILQQAIAEAESTDEL